MIAALFKLFLLFIVFFLVAAIFTTARIFRSFRNLSDRFKDAQNGMGGGARGQRRYGNDSQDEVIYDSRTPEEANKKIFSKNEGEYVDFEEEKN